MFAAMVVQLKRSDFLRLLGTRGTSIEVVSGIAWITEEGRAADTLLRPGHRYRVLGDGLVLVTPGNPEAGTVVTVGQ